MNPQVGYPSPAPSGPAAPPAPSRPLASPWDRLVARIVDGLILFLPIALLFVVLFGIPLFLSLASSEGNGASENGVLLWMFVAVVGYALAIAATGLLTYWYAVRNGGRTPGKRWRRIRVVNPDGTALTAAQARKRWLAADGVAVLGSIPFLGALIGIYVLLNNLWLLWDKPYQRCLHDKYAKTIVVKAADG